MRIAIVSYQGFDGAGVLHAHEFANRLADRGHDVVFWLNGDERTAELLAEAPRYRLHEVTFEAGLLAPASRRLAEEHAAEIVHLWTPRHLPARLGLELFEASDARLVIHYEDDEEYILSRVSSNDRFAPDDLALYRFFRAESCDAARLAAVVESLDLEFVRHSLLEPRSWSWIHPLVTPVVEKLADAYTAISPSYQRLLRRRYPGPVRILYPGVDHARFAPRQAPPELVQRLGLEGRTVLVYSGSIAAFHDFTSVLRALPPVVAAHPDVVLVQIGHNYIEETTDRLLAELGLAGHAVFTGAVPHHQMADYLALADAYVASVRVDEFNGHRLPSKIPEYMAMGRPMLIMDHGVGHELEAGSEVVKVTDDAPATLSAALLDLLARRGDWAAMGGRLREKARELFDWERNTEHLLALYGELLERPARELPEGLDAEAPVPGLEELGYRRPSKPAPRRAAASAPDGRRRVVILTEGLVGKKMSGTGIRYLEIARALAESFDVALAQRHPGELEVEGVEWLEWQVEAPGAGLEAALEADVVLTHGYVLEKMPRLREIPGRLVIDLYCPFLFENLEIHRDRGVPLVEREGIHDNDLRVLLEQLEAGDYFLCCTERQRDWILGMLTALGRIRPGSCVPGITPDDFVGLVPFGLPEEAPTPAPARVLKGVWPGVGEDDLVLLWGGGLWSWLDPLTPIEAMAEVARSRPEVKLVFLSTRTAESVIGMPMMGMACELADRLGLTGRSVIFNSESYIDYAERGAYFLESDVGVCAHGPGLETYFAFRTRVLDYLSAGLPFLTSEGDFFGDYAQQHGLGRALPIGDVDAWVRAILELAEDAEERRKLRERVLAKRQELAWPRVVEPLVRYCALDDADRRGLSPSRPRAAAPAPTASATTQAAESAYELSTDALVAEVEQRISRLGGSNAALAARCAQLEARLGELEEHHAWLSGHAARLDAKVDMVRRLPLARELWQLLARRGRA